MIVYYITSEGDNVILDISRPLVHSLVMKNSKLLISEDLLKQDFSLK